MIISLYSEKIHTVMKEKNPNIVSVCFEDAHEIKEYASDAVNALSAKKIINE